MAIERIEQISGPAVPVRGDNIDTDRIIPARFLRSVSFEGLEDHLFEDDRTQAPDHPLSSSRYARAAIMIVNANFGCGSSREHAPQAIRRRGIRGVIGQSFSEIFFGNSVAMGMPCVTASADDVGALMEMVERSPDTQLTIDLRRMVITAEDREFTMRLPAAARESFLAGTWDATALLLDRFEEVERVARRLPYVAGW